MQRVPRPPVLKVVSLHATHATPCDSCPGEQPASDTSNASVGWMANPPTAQVSIRPYVSPCGATSVKASNVARCDDADMGMIVCCKKMLDVSLVVVADAFSVMVHMTAGSASGGRGVESTTHGVVAAPLGGAATMPTANAGSAAPT